jgi:hypothetical protein
MMGGDIRSVIAYCVVVDRPHVHRNISPKQNLENFCRFPSFDHNRIFPVIGALIGMQPLFLVSMTI